MQRLEEDNKRLHQDKLPIANNLANQLRRNDYLWALDISNCRLQVHASTHENTCRHKHKRRHTQMQMQRIPHRIHAERIAVLFHSHDPNPNPNPNPKR